MNRAERRKRTFYIINKRKAKLKNWSNASEKIEDGYYENNSIMNEYGSAGKAIKTNTRKSHASYRHKGGYGSANKYKPHDQRQIDQELDQEEEE